MRPDLVVLRPEPGASATAARSAALGLTALVAPLFEVKPVEWSPPDDRPEAVLLTSANAARHGGAGLGLLLDLPCYAAGDSTAEAAREAGFANVASASADGAAALALLAVNGPRSVLHLCGREHIALDREGVRVERRIVYAADPLPLEDVARDALAEGAVGLVHSPRAGARLAQLLPERGAVRIAAISAAAARSAEVGWAEIAVAQRPDDSALLAIAARLCHNARR